METVNEHVRALPAEGHTVRWCAWTGDDIEESTLRFENGAWTVESLMHGADVHYVLRLDPHWRVQQFMLFRDLADPDLWLATDGGGRWGEVNGAHRVDLDACTDIEVTGSPLHPSLLVRRLPLHIGHAADVRVALVDVHTLSVTPQSRRISRLDERSWRLEHHDDRGAVQHSQEVDVDEFGFVVDVPGSARRLG